MLVNNHHVPTKFIYGRNKAWERSQVKHEFNEKGGFVLIASTIFDEGVDIPEINV
jgi:superfamily II DNA or RNA helicase